MAQTTPVEGIKEKIQEVREVVLNRSTNDIVLVLQHYDNDVEKTIQAFLEDGAKEALQEWHVPGNKPANKKKKKKPLSKAKEESSSSEPMSNGPKQTSTHISKDQDKQNTSQGPVAPGSAPAKNTPQQQSRKNEGHAPPHEGGAKPRPSTAPPQSKNHHPESSSSVSQRQQDTRPKNLERPKGRDRTASERSEGSVGITTQGNRRPHAGLEKSVKDLQRQTTSLQRLKTLLQDEMDRSQKKLKGMFESFHDCLNEREAELMFELDKVKDEAVKTLAKRQEKAKELRVGIEKAQRMNESQLHELRGDIKHFVSDRKIDEDISSQQRLICDPEKLIETLKTFAEVVPVKHVYSTRRPSISSTISSVSDLMSPTTPSSFQAFAPVHIAPGSSHTNTSTALASTSAVSSTDHILDGPAGPFTVSSTSMTTSELSELQKKLKDSLKLQGLPVKSPPRRVNQNPRGKGERPRQTSQGERQRQTSQGDRSKQAGRVDRPRQTSQGDRPRQTGQGDRPRQTGQGDRPRQTGQGDRPRQTSQGDKQGPNRGPRPQGNQSNQDLDDKKKSRSARRRQKQRERDREARKGEENGEKGPSQSPPKTPDSRQSPEKDNTKPRSNPASPRRARPQGQRNQRKTPTREEQGNEKETQKKDNETKITDKDTTGASGAGPKRNDAKPKNTGGKTENKPDGRQEKGTQNERSGSPEKRNEGRNRGRGRGGPSPQKSSEEESSPKQGNSTVNNNNNNKPETDSPKQNGVHVDQNKNITHGKEIAQKQTTAAPSGSSENHKQINGDISTSNGPKPATGSVGEGQKEPLPQRTPRDRGQREVKKTEVIVNGDMNGHTE